ncbi:hypothetical protein GCM10018954_075660 [Kutzneria kofuensis]
MAWAVGGHDGDDAAVGGAEAQLVDEGLRVIEVAQHAVAQDGGEAAAVDGLNRVLAVGVHEGDPLPDLGRQSGEALAGLGQHRLGRVEECHVVTGLGQRKRLVAGPAADVENRGGRGRQVIEQLPVQHVGPHIPLHGGVGLVGELVGQLGPGVIVHPTIVALDLQRAGYCTVVG